MPKVFLSRQDFLGVGRERANKLFFYFGPKEQSDEALSTGEGAGVVPVSLIMLCSTVPQNQYPYDRHRLCTLCPGDPWPEPTESQRRPQIILLLMSSNTIIK